MTQLSNISEYKLYLHNDYIFRNIYYEWSDIDLYNIEIINNKLYNKLTKSYLVYNTDDYIVRFDSNKNNGTTIFYDNNSIYTYKNLLLIKYNKYNLDNHEIINTYLSNRDNYYKSLYKKIGILLAGGNSTRFGIKYKQLFKLNGISLIDYSVKAMINLDYIIIVTNSNCYNEMNIKYSSNPKIKLLINDVDCRLESLSVGLEYIKEHIKDNCKVIIHDSARPYVTDTHIQKLLDNTDNSPYSQYVLKLYNGLLKINNLFEDINRDDYIELCTPLCINFNLGYFIFKNYIAKNNRITYEFLPILKAMGITYKLEYGNISYLKKITTIEDII